MEVSGQRVDGAGPAPEFLSGGGIMGRRGSTIGPPHPWVPHPNGRRASALVSICLGTNFPIAIYWGNELALLSNDAWSPSRRKESLGTGAARPRCVAGDMGRNRAALREGPENRGGRLVGRSTAADAPLRIHRGSYFNFTFSPIRGEYVRVDGIFNSIVETTFRVIGARRERTLRELADLKLPGKVDGWQIAERCREHPPDLLVIYATGFSPVTLRAGPGEPDAAEALPSGAGRASRPQLDFRAGVSLRLPLSRVGDLPK